MWTRKELKDRAKEVLKGIYWKAFWISIVIALAGGSRGGGGSGGSAGRSSGYNGSRGFSPFEAVIPRDFLDPTFIWSVVIGFGIFIIALRIFLGYSLEVGGRRFFVKSAQYEDNSKCFRFAFDGQNYMGIVSAMLLRGVQNFLWYLLLIIPGIIKSYEYAMVPYILADNPNIGAQDAIKISMEMTEGHKLDMFVLDLSFIGWYILGTLALFVGVLFVMPYENATKAELYLVLRQNRLGEI